MKTKTFLKKKPILVFAYFFAIAINLGFTQNQNTETRTVIAYTNTDNNQNEQGRWVDTKVIYIPEGWSYYSHEYHETTGLGDRRIYTPEVVRDPRNLSRIVAISIKVEAFAKIFGRSWVGAELDVTITRNP